ncbi:MAG: TlpA family protein disulfide reductase [Lentisphaerae bacterium]|jgi:hypothetical protein|nr:TlpA family protein disulfide reductase [Lentisphaerota bacterium]
MLKNISLFLVMLMLAAVSSATAQVSGDFDAQQRAVLSRLQTMGHGYYSAQEWADVEQSVNDLMANARDRKDGDAIIAATIIKAMVLSDMRHFHDEAVKELQQARKLVKNMPGVDASRLYVKEAEVQAAAGNAPAVQKLIKDYKASPYYNPQPYSWSGGTAPGDPLVLTRPGAPGNDSLPLSIMESALARATAAPGVGFPDATLTDIYGNPVSISSLRGSVVLVDFFARGWHRWEADRSLIAHLWNNHYKSGNFQVINICLERNPIGLESAGLPGIVVPNARALAAELGVFGDRTTFLLDAQGRVIARNLSGQDLAFAVRQALEQ